VITSEWSVEKQIKNEKKKTDAIEVSGYDQMKVGWCSTKL